MTSPREPKDTPVYPVYLSANPATVKEMDNADRGSTCPTCGRTFASYRGRRVHERSAHPRVYHLEETDRVDFQSRKPRWHEEEVERMARYEALHYGDRFLNRAIHRHVLSHRSIESIKGHRRRADYKALVVSLRQHDAELAAEPFSPAQGPPEPRATMPPIRVGNEAVGGRGVGARVSGGPAEGCPLGGNHGRGGRGCSNSTTIKISPRRERGITTRQRRRRSSGEALVGGPQTGEAEGATAAVSRSSSSGTLDSGSESTSTSLSLSPGDARPRTRQMARRVACRVELPPQERPPDRRPSLPEPHGGRRPIECLRRAIEESSRSIGIPFPQSSSVVEERFRDWIPASEAPVWREPAIPRDQPLTRTQKNRRRFRVAQKLWGKDRSRVVDQVLNDQLDSAPQTPPGLADYWVSLFGRASRPDQRSPEPLEVHHELARPITAQEVRLALTNTKKDTAPGPDGIRWEGMVAVSPDRLAWGFNAVLLHGEIPASWARGRTTLIPKKPVPEGPGDYRPITVTSIITRTFNKILAGRCLVACPLPMSQKGFALEEGVASNLLLLQAVIKHCTTQLCPGIVAFLDFRKAFDSLYHQSLLRAAERWGLPDILVRYIADLYSKASTTIMGRETQIRRGVLQGDPLSPFLFNITLDWVLTELSPAAGVRVEGTRIAYLAYADDVALIASTPSGMQEQLRLLTSAARLVGLELGPGKCATLNIRVDKKKKLWFVDARRRFFIEETPIRALEPDGTYRYLGLELGPTLRTKEPVQALKELTSHLIKVQRAPFKPQQKMWALKYVVFPKHIYKRVLGRSPKNLLNRMDLEIRKFLRQALHLPSDTPVSHFYAELSDGGLGIPSFLNRVEVLRLAMRERLLRSPDHRVVSVSQNLLPSGPLQSRETKKVQQERNQLDWHRTLDGKGMRESSTSPKLHTWVDSGTRLMSGSKYVQAIKIRAGVVPTRVRAARGRPAAPVLCSNGCGRVESLGHMLQTCPVLAPERTVRHDRVLDLVVGLLGRDPSRTVLREPSIRTSAGLRKPDIVVSDGNRSAVIDVQVTSDSSAFTLQAAHDLKVRYYQNPEVASWVQGTTGKPPIFSSVTINWRGIMATQSCNTLRDWGVSNRDLELLVVRSLEGSAQILRAARDHGGHGRV